MYMYYSTINDKLVGTGIEDLISATKRPIYMGLDDICLIPLTKAVRTVMYDQQMHQITPPNPITLQGQGHPINVLLVSQSQILVSFAIRPAVLCS